MFANCFCFRLRRSWSKNVVSLPKQQQDWAHSFDSEVGINLLFELKNWRGFWINKSCLELNPDLDNVAVLEQMMQIPELAANAKFKQGVEEIKVKLWTDLHCIHTLDKFIIE